MEYPDIPDQYSDIGKRYEHCINEEILVMTLTERFQNMFDKFYWFFYRVIHPSFWTMNYSYNKEVDLIIEIVINKELFGSNDSYTMKVENLPRIWLKNYPYAYGTIAGLVGRPSIRNILRLKKYQNAILFKEFLREHE